MTTVQTRSPRAPASETIIHALARMIDDSQSERRDPSHSDIEFQIKRAGLSAGDPAAVGQTVGKAKRVRAVLFWALENAPTKAEMFVQGLLALVRANGGFRTESPNFVGDEAITNAAGVFKAEGFTLDRDGELRPTSLDTLSDGELVSALEAYARRARRGSEDAALLVGTGKDLLEAVAAHILFSSYGSYPQQADFPTLLGQAFVNLGLATPHSVAKTAETAKTRLEKAYYEASCAVNGLRNKQGTGHGRPWLPNVTDDEAAAAVQMIGIVASLMLNVDRRRKP
jgi:hypothetical protein